MADLRAWLSDTYGSSFNSTSAPHYLLSALNPIAWFLNLRGGDIAFDPVFYAYVLVSRDKVRIWVQRSSLTSKVEQAIADLGGEIRDYQEAMREVEEIVAAEEGNFLVTDATVSWAVVDQVGQVCSKNRLDFVVRRALTAAIGRTRSSSFKNRLSTRLKRSRTKSKSMALGGPTSATVPHGCVVFSHVCITHHRTDRFPAPRPAGKLGSRSRSPRAKRSPSGTQLKSSPSTARRERTLPT